jgi:hypothetical protein
MSNPPSPNAANDIIVEQYANLKPGINYITDARDANNVFYLKVYMDGNGVVQPSMALPGPAPQPSYYNRSFNFITLTR